MPQSRRFTLLNDVDVKRTKGNGLFLFVAFTLMTEEKNYKVRVLSAIKSIEQVEP